MPHLSIRIDFDDEGRLGPGKVALLEQIESEGSISASGRSWQVGGAQRQVGDARTPQSAFTDSGGAANAAR